jgi:hypothetical protein
VKDYSAGAGLLEPDFFFVALLPSPFSFLP